MNMDRVRKAATFGAKKLWLGVWWDVCRSMLKAFVVNEVGMADSEIRIKNKFNEIVYRIFDA